MSPFTVGRHQNFTFDTDRIGSAPDIAGKGVANPIGMILSVAMMLKYSLALPTEAADVEDAVRRALEKGIRTADIGGSASTKEMGDAVVRALLEDHC